MKLQASRAHQAALHVDMLYRVLLTDADVAVRGVHALPEALVADGEVGEQQVHVARLPLPPPRGVPLLGVVLDGGVAVGAVAHNKRQPREAAREPLLQAVGPGALRLRPNAFTTKDSGEVGINKKDPLVVSSRLTARRGQPSQPSRRRTCTRCRPSWRCRARRRRCPCRRARPCGGRGAAGGSRPWPLRGGRTG